MWVELYKNDIPFITDILRWAPLCAVFEKLKQSVTSPECDEFVCCKLTTEELEELVGYLSMEANHNKSPRVAQGACEIADYLEDQLR